MHCISAVSDTGVPILHRWGEDALLSSRKSTEMELGEQVEVGRAVGGWATVIGEKSIATRALTEWKFGS